jgi:isoamylase/glycogen operon protein
MVDTVQIKKGSPDPLGLDIQEDTINFSLYSSIQEPVFLRIYQGDIYREFPTNRTGDRRHIALSGLSKSAEYCYRIGQLELADPRSRFPSTGLEWMKGNKGVRSKCAPPPPFDWEGVKRPGIPLQDLVIYEMHVRGFTRHPSSQAKHPGTFLGLIEKIPYLKKLGVNAIELMPIFEFDETRAKNIHPKTGKKLPNYWGYDPLYFFAPMSRYAHGSPLTECKMLVRELHRAGLELILDCVFNHTGEGRQTDQTVSFRGIDPATYYLLNPQGHNLDFTGCGNTFNANHPVAQEFILDSLRFWIEEVGVDGFRLDLTSCLTRDTDGQTLASPPLLEAIRKDPSCQKVKWIAEPWDAAGLYQVGYFPRWGKNWSEWNGKYRDEIRSFIKGAPGHAGTFASALSGSEPLYGPYSPLSSVNFITAHDGFSLSDLVSYSHKLNFDNGDQNKDGQDQNISWNSGFEGEGAPPQIQALRERQMRNFLLALFLSQGVPMLLMGDEYGHTRKGNNNPYVQDNEINWFLWDQLKKRQTQFDFVSSLIAFRKAHPSLKRRTFLTDNDVDWLQTSWDPSSKLVLYRLKAKPSLFIAFNAHETEKEISLPPGFQWREVVSTQNNWDRHFFNKEGPLLASKVELPPHSALIAKEP